MDLKDRENGRVHTGFLCSKTYSNDLHVPQTLVNSRLADGLTNVVTNQYTNSLNFLRQTHL
jgi:hypothetical protein